MKRILSFMFLSLVMFFFVASPKQMTYAVNLNENAVIILSGNINEKRELVIDANLTTNSGISGMTLELVYNKNVMTLTNVKFGTALASLEPITTNTNTELGYSITPFKINYLGKENDYSTGKLFTLIFELDDTIGDGNYRISLKYRKNLDVNYIDTNGELKTKNLYIDNAEVEIKDNAVMQITSVRDSEENSKTWIVILCVSVGVIAVGTIVTVVILLKKRRNWKRL